MLILAQVGRTSFITDLFQKAPRKSEARGLPHLTFSLLFRVQLHITGDTQPAKYPKTTFFFFLKPAAWRASPRKPTSAQREGLLEEKKRQVHLPAAPGDRSDFAAPVPPRHAMEAKELYFLKSSTSAVLSASSFCNK